MNHFQHFLNILFSCFEEKKVAYCVLHSYESLPEYASSDVDMAIDFRQRKRLDGLLHRAAKESGFKIVQKICQDIPCCHYYALTNIDSPQMDIIKLDFLIDNYGLNKYCLPSGALLERRVRYKNFYVPPDGAQAAYLLIKKTFKEKLTEENMKKLRELYISNSRDVALFLEKYFGKSADSEALSAIKEGNRGKIVHLIPRLKAGIKKNCRRPFVKKNIWSVRRILSRVLHPTGELIVFLSPDGGGKSSMARSALTRLSGGFFWEAAGLHWRPGVLPKIRTLMGRPETDIEFVIANPHSPKRRSRLVSLLRWMYYSLDYVIGYYLKILPMKVKTTAVIMDRYYYDILVDPVRYGFNLPQWLLKLPLRFIPKPDLTIYLDNKPEELYQRKQELPLPELKRQVEAWREFIPSLPNARIVATNKPLEDVVHEVTRIVLERRTEMTRKMLKIEPEASQYLWKSDITDYIALPSKKSCRWIIPTNPKLAKKAWELYQPYSLKGKIFKKIMLMISSFGILRLMKPIKLEN